MKTLTEYFAHRGGRLINTFGEGTDDFAACSPILAESYEEAEAEARKLWSDESVDVITKEDAAA